MCVFVPSLYVCSSLRLQVLDKFLVHQHGKVTCNNQPERNSLYQTQRINSSAAFLTALGLCEGFYIPNLNKQLQDVRGRRFGSAQYLRDLWCHGLDSGANYKRPNVGCILPHLSIWIVCSWPARLTERRCTTTLLLVQFAAHSYIMKPKTLKSQICSSC